MSQVAGLVEVYGAKTRVVGGTWAPHLFFLGRCGLGDDSDMRISRLRGGLLWSQLKALGLPGGPLSSEALFPQMPNRDGSPPEEDLQMKADPGPDHASPPLCPPSSLAAPRRAPKERELFVICVIMPFPLWALTTGML